MKQKGRIIVANWKMNGSISLCDEIIAFTLEQLNNLKLEAEFNNKVKIIICPPYPYTVPLYTELNKLQNKDSVNIEIGAQDCSIYSSGSYTGEVSAAMLKDIGCTYVIIGHSERRINNNENGYAICKKIKLAYENNLTPIICIGESLEDFENGVTKNVLQKQIEEIKEVLDQYKYTMIAYEPVWAIGTGKIPNPQEIMSVQNFINEQLSNYNIALLYGGSVNSANINTILSVEHVDGTLIGGASVKPFEWISMLKSVFTNKDS